MFESLKSKELNGKLRNSKDIVDDVIDYIRLKNAGSKGLRQHGEEKEEGDGQQGQ